MWKRYLPFQHHVTNPLYQLFRTIWGCFSTCFSFQVNKQVISLCLDVFSSLSGWVHVIVKMSKEVHKLFCGWIDKTQCYLQGVIWGSTPGHSAKLIWTIQSPWFCKLGCRSWENRLSHKLAGTFSSNLSQENSKKEQPFSYHFGISGHGPGWKIKVQNHLTEHFTR